MKEHEITLAETQLGKNEWLSNRHIERFVQHIIKQDYNKINYFKPTIICLNSFKPNITEKTTFIYFVTNNHWVTISKF